MNIKGNIKILLNKIRKHTELFSYKLATNLKNNSMVELDFEKSKKLTLSYIENMRNKKEIYNYKFSNSTQKPNIYSSLYACMIYHLYKELDNFNKEDKIKWISYFDSFQSKEDGLFYDSSLENDLFYDTDWWGARHFAAHVIIAYSALGARPKYKFKFLEKYYNKDNLLGWLENTNWNIAFSSSNDIDNKILNIGCLLQYSRDYFNDNKAGDALKWLLKFLEKKINCQTGMWGDYNLDKPEELSRMVQFAYHLFILFFYEAYDIKYKEKIIDIVLKTQNTIGGYGVSLNSSACEDIDSIYILVKLYQKTDYKKKEIKESLEKALYWILSNMNKDGGFVFKKNEKLFYGHQNMSSVKNESAMFPTWFRTLSLAYLSKVIFVSDLNKINWQFVDCPGLQFWKI